MWKELFSGLFRLFRSHRVPPAAIDFTLTRSDKFWYAIPSDGTARFLVGREISDAQAGYFGLFMPVGQYYGPQYCGTDYATRLGTYAYLLEVSGYCESKNRFNLVNTYDRARFTFGFCQLAAHTPRDNLILLLRDLVDAGLAATYFPDLRIIDDALHCVGRSGESSNLETLFPSGPDGSVELRLLMDYLNPRRQQLDREEILNAARLMHMANSNARARDLQVERAAQILRSRMEHFGTRYGLDGRSDTLCAVIADIHHQGRATAQRVSQALAGPDPLDRLIDINARYRQRSVDLRAVVSRLEAEGQLGRRKYQMRSNDFV